MLAGTGGQHPLTRPLSNDLRDRAVAAQQGGESCRRGEFLLNRIEKFSRRGKVSRSDGGAN